MSRTSAVGPEGEMRIPDYIEPVRGYRMWNVSQLDDRWYLSSSATVGVTWPVDGPLVAHHVGDGAKWLSMNIYHLAEADPVAPVKGCSCGVYAYNDPKHITRNGEAVLFRRIIGEVDMWGKVWEHDDGWRAEYARPAALWDTGASGMGRPALTLLGDRYGIPVVTHDKP